MVGGKDKKMANHREKKQGECLARIGVQAKYLCEYILNPKANKGRIELRVVKEMSNVIVSNVKLLEELDKKCGGDA